MTMHHATHIRAFRAAAGVITPGCRVGAGQRGCGGAGKNNYDTVARPGNRNSDGA